MKRLTMIIIAIIALFALGWAVGATPSNLSIDWWTVDGGGATFSSGGAYRLGGTIGQPDAGDLSGGSYRVVGGFWGFKPGGTSLPADHTIYAPAILRGGP